MRFEILVQRMTLPFGSPLGVGALRARGLSRFLQRHPDEGGDVKATDVLTVFTPAGILDSLGRLRVVELDRLLVREHTVAPLDLGPRPLDHPRARRVRERLEIRVRSIRARGPSQVVHHGFHAVVGDLVVHVGMRGEDSLLRVDFAAPVGLVGFGEVRLRHEPVAEHAARLQVFPKDVHHATLPEAVAGDGQGGSVMHAQRVPWRCSGRYAVGALPRLEGPAAVSSSAGWGARVSSAVPRGRAGKGRLPDVLSRRSVNIDHHHVDRESTCDRSGRGGRF